MAARLGTCGNWIGPCKRRRRLPFTRRPPPCRGRKSRQRRAHPIWPASAQHSRRRDSPYQSRPKADQSQLEWRAWISNSLIELHLYRHAVMASTEQPADRSHPAKRDQYARYYRARELLVNERCPRYSALVAGAAMPVSPQVSLTGERESPRLLPSSSCHRQLSRGGCRGPRWQN